MVIRQRLQWHKAISQPSLAGQWRSAGVALLGFDISMLMLTTMMVM
jgi:hypothetical protein